MKINELGVLPESNAYFHTPSVMAQHLFFTLNCTGHYFCNEYYAVSRAAYDSFLILYVVRGKGYCYLDNRRVELHVGSLVILDCYLPQRYGTDSSWEIYWIHFTGYNCEKIIQKYNLHNCYIGEHSFLKTFLHLYNPLQVLSSHRSSVFVKTPHKKKNQKIVPTQLPVHNFLRSDSVKAIS